MDEDTTENLPAKRGPKTGNTRLAMTDERKAAFLAAYELSANFAAAAAIASPNSMAQPRSRPGTASFRALVAEFGTLCPGSLHLLGSGLSDLKFADP